jgi:hypothetical protein
MEVATPSRPEKAAIAPRLAPWESGVGNSRDTLTKADRLEVAQLLYGAPVQLVSLGEKMPPAGPAAINSQETPKSTDRRDGGAGAGKVAGAQPKPKPKQAAPRPTELRHLEAKHAEPGKAAQPDRSKAFTEIRSCQANAIASLLKVFNLSPGCET